MVRKFAVAVVSLLLANAATAATLYVSTSGNDANAGSATAPLKTINRAAALARAGDIVYVRGGVYYDKVSISSVGTSTAPIAFRAYPGELPVIDGGSTATSTDLVTLYQANYVEFSGFEVRNSKRIGISGWESKNITISNNNVHHSQTTGIYAGAGTFGIAGGITISGNTVTNNVLSNQYHTLQYGGWGQAVSVQYVNGAKITGNRIYNNDGEGIAFILTDNGVARSNQVYDNFSVGIYLDNAQATTADANFVYSTGNTRYYRDGYPASGIAMANESYGADTNPCSGLTVTNNIVVQSRFGLYYGNDNGGGLKNSTIANNTFYKAAQTLVSIAADVNSGNIVENNIFVQSGAVMTAVAASGFTFRNNLWYGGTAGTAAGSGDVIGDPRFVGVGGLTAADYKLTSTSPALQKAIDATSIGNDYFGNVRTSGYDMGAHELSADSTTTTTSTAASVPSNVTAKAVSSSSIAVSWSASSNAASYRVYRGGALVATVSQTSWTDSGLAASTSYSYQVSAVNSAGTESARSATVTATTASAADSFCPTAPGSLAVTGTTTSSISLKWNASTDNVGVSSYRVYRSGVLVATISSAYTSWTNTGLARKTTYSYTVRAVDAAGNVSAASNSVKGRTN